MDKDEFQDYLQLEFNVLDPSQLSETYKYIAYERLKHQILDKNLSADEYTQAIINLSDYLEL